MLLGCLAGDDVPREEESAESWNSRGEGEVLDDAFASLRGGVACIVGFNNTTIRPSGQTFKDRGVIESDYLFR